MRWLWLPLMVGCTPAGTGVGIVNKSNTGAEGNAKVSWTPDELTITDCTVGQARSASVEVSSVGDANLHLYTVELIGDESIFYFQRSEDLEFAPGTSDSYPVVATLQVEEPAEATLRITTDDVDHREVRVAVHAWPVGYVPPADTGGDTGDTGDTAVTKP